MSAELDDDGLLYAVCIANPSAVQELILFNDNDVVLHRDVVLATVAILTALLAGFD